MSGVPGEINAAMRAGFRVVVHDTFFPFESVKDEKPVTVHAVVDRAAQAIYCSQEWFDKLPKAGA